MNVLTGYIVKEILKASAAAVTLLLTLFMLFAFRDELGDIGKGGYGLKEILMYLALSAPTVFYELVPFGALLGSLFVVGAMGNNSEIIAMRAAGFSVFWIIKSVMIAGVFMAATAFVVGEFVATEAVQEAEILKMTAQHNEVNIKEKYGVWLREKGAFVNVRKIIGKGELGEIYTYTVDDQGELLAVTKIDEAVFLGQGRWGVNGISKTEVLTDRVLSNHQISSEWKTSIKPDLLNVAVVKSDNMSLFDLYTYIDFLKKNNQKTQSFELAFWSRLINPLIVFVMLMVSIPFVIGIKRGVSTGGRMMIGVIIGMMFNIFDKIAGHVGLVYGYDPLLMAILPSLIVFCTATYIVSKVK